MPKTIYVEFRSAESVSDNCICNACHGVGRVTKLVLPRTLYVDGKHLGTKYTDYWLCRQCRDKLVKALKQEG